MESSAFHEAGHAWAYRRHNKPLRYVSLRPRRPGMVAICQPWRARSIDVAASALIASAGPIAQAHHSMATDPEADEYEFADFLTTAVLTGGDDDYEKSLGMLDDPPSVQWLRDELVRDWSGVERLAGLLLRDRTVTGREAFEVLSRG